MRPGRLTATTALCLTLLAPGAAADVTPAERKLVHELSKVRQQNGLSPLRASRTLARSAGRYSKWQLRNDYFGHQASIRMSSRFRVRGEVLRWVGGWRLGVGRTVRLWLRSASHRAAILHPALRLAGAGVARGRFRGRLALFVTVHLGAR